MEKGPWLFWERAVLLAPYDGLSDPDDVESEFMSIWLQVHKLSEGYGKEVVSQPVGCVASEIMVVERNPVRMMVKHDVPLTRFVLSRDAKRHLFAVKYEILGMMCYAFGLIGHVYKECGLGTHDEKDLKYGDSWEKCLLAWEDMEETALMMALAVAVAVVWEEASG